MQRDAFDPQVLLKTQAEHMVASVFPNPRPPLTEWFSFEETVEKVEKYDNLVESRRQQRVEEKKEKLELEYQQDPWNAKWTQFQQFDQFGNQMPIDIDPGDDPNFDEAEDSEDEETYAQPSISDDPTDSDLTDPYWMMNAIHRFAEDYTVVKLISMNPFGPPSSVRRLTWLVKDTETGDLKVLSIARDMGKRFRYYGNIPREIYMHSRLNNECEFIVTFEEWCWINRNVYAMVEPYVPHCPITLNYVHDVHALARYTECVVRALIHLKKREVVHRDISMENILWDPVNCIARLTDFDQAVMENNEGFVTYTGRWDYMAPEKRKIIQTRINHRNEYPNEPPPKTGVYTSRADLYSLGVILFCVINMLPKPPSQADVIRGRAMLEDRNSLCNLVRQLLAKASIRILLGDILKHPFFEEFEKPSRSEKRMRQYLKQCITSGVQRKTELLKLKEEQSDEYDEESDEYTDDSDEYEDETDDSEYTGDSDEYTDESEEHDEPIVLNNTNYKPPPLPKLNNGLTSLPKVNTGLPSQSTGKPLGKPSFAKKFAQSQQQKFTPVPLKRSPQPSMSSIGGPPITDERKLTPMPTFRLPDIKEVPLMTMVKQLDQEQQQDPMFKMLSFEKPSKPVGTSRLVTKTPLKLRKPKKPVEGQHKTTNVHKVDKVTPPVLRARSKKHVPKKKPVLRSKP